MKKLTFFLSILIIGLSAKAQYTERVTDNVMFRRNGASISRLSILIPIPQTNQYQTVHNVAYEGVCIARWTIQMTVMPDSNSTTSPMTTSWWV